MGIPYNTWKEQNTVYTVKWWDGAHSLLKFAILNHNWRITDDRTQENMSNQFKGKYSLLFMFSDILNLESSARWIW